MAIQWGKSWRRPDRMRSSSTWGHHSPKLKNSKLSTKHSIRYINIFFPTREVGCGLKSFISHKFQSMDRWNKTPGYPRASTSYQKTWAKEMPEMRASTVYATWTYFLVWITQAQSILVWTMSGRIGWAFSSYISCTRSKMDYHYWEENTYSWWNLKGESGSSVKLKRALSWSQRCETFDFTSKVTQYMAILHITSSHTSTWKLMRKPTIWVFDLDQNTMYFLL